MAAVGCLGTSDFVFVCVLFVVLGDVIWESVEGGDGMVAMEALMEWINAIVVFSYPSGNAAQTQMRRIKAKSGRYGVFVRRACGTLYACRDQYILLEYYCTPLRVLLRMKKL